MSTAFKGTFTRIKDSISTARRLPRLGKIRLGLKKVSAKSGKEYPTETDYFVVPPEVAAVYGDKPKELDVMFPVDDEEIVFPQALEYYGSSKGLKCQGNKETAMERDEATGKWSQRTCPCEKLDAPGGCSQTGHLMVLLPKVSLGGIYQIDTRSFNGHVDILSGFSYARLMVERIALVPFKLKREPRESHVNGQKQIHYPMKLILDADMNGVIQMRADTKRIVQSTVYQIEAPVLDGPKADPPDLVEDEPEVVDAELPAQEAQVPAPPGPPKQEPPNVEPPKQTKPKPEPKVSPEAVVSAGTIGTYTPKQGTRPGKFILHTDHGDLELIFWDTAFVDGISERSGLVQCTWELRTSGKYRSNTLVKPIEWLEEAWEAPTA